MLLTNRKLDCLIIGVGAVLVGAAADVSAGATVTVRAPAGSAAVSNFWTPRRVETAKPMPFYDEERDPQATPADLRNELQDLGPPSTAPGSGPGRSPPFSAIEESDLEAVAPADGIDFGTKDTLDAFAGYQDIWSNSVYPWRAVGKLWFSDAAGGYTCSASVIGAQNALVTAAHCCYDRAAKRWYGNFVFRPGADGSSYPYGSYAWTSATVLSKWITAGGRENDVCVIKTAAGLSAKVGWLGRSWNFPQTEHVFTWGYPGNKDSGLRQNACASENYANCGSSLVNATGCDKTYGDSGAPWIRVYRPRQSGAMNYVNSVTSGVDSCTGTFGRSYNGARFTSNNIVPLCTAAKCD